MKASPEEQAFIDSAKNATEESARLAQLPGMPDSIIKMLMDKKPLNEVYGHCASICKDYNEFTTACESAFGKICQSKELSRAPTLKDFIKDIGNTKKPQDFYQKLFEIAKKHTSKPTV